MVIYCDFEMEQHNLDFFFYGNVFVQGNFNFEDVNVWQLAYFNPVKDIN